MQQNIKWENWTIYLKWIKNWTTEKNYKQNKNMNVDQIIKQIHNTPTPREWQKIVDETEKNNVQIKKLNLTTHSTLAF